MIVRPIPLFGIGSAGKSVNVNAQQRKNLYLEVKQDDEGKHILTLFGTPGITTFVNFGSEPIRGLYQKDSYIYVAHRETLYRLANNGTTTILGTLLTVGGRVNFSDNGNQIMLVDGTYGYIYNTSTLAFTQIVDADFPGGNTVTFLNGRFIVNDPDSGQFFWSALYDGTSWDALDYATAESDPDNIVSLVAEQGQLVLFGSKTTEFWADSGAADSPYARVGASAIEWGLAAVNSLCKFMDSLIFLRKNRLGQVQVCILSGYQAIPVSGPDMDYVLGTYGDVSNATGFAYMMNGHPFYQINFPSENKSWLYDGQSKAWSEVESSGGRHRGEQFVNLLGTMYVSDYENGKLYEMSQTIYTEENQTIVREFIGRHQSSANLSVFSQVWLEMESGVGLQSGQGSDPQIMLTVSKDGGHEWGNELWRSFGMVGKYKTRAVWNRLGMARDWLFKFRITDPVKVVIIAAWGQVR